MSFYVYILHCADDTYTGHTDNLEARIARHVSGETEGYTYTSTRLPVRLVFSEQFPTREEALAYERQIKAWSQKKTKQTRIRNDWAEVSR